MRVEIDRRRQGFVLETETVAELEGEDRFRTTGWLYKTNGVASVVDESP